MSTTTTTPDCCRSDCREPATTRRIYRAKSGRTWKRDACAAHHALSAAENETYDAMGLVTESVETIPATGVTA